MLALLLSFSNLRVISVSFVFCRCDKYSALSNANHCMRTNFEKYSAF